MLKGYGDKCCDRCGELIPPGDTFEVQIRREGYVRTAKYEICWECCQMLAELIDQAGKPAQTEGRL